MKRKKKVVRLKKQAAIPLLIICISLFIYSSFKIVRWHIENKNNSTITEKIKDEVIKIEKDEIIVDEEKLKTISENAFGYIIINNTNIDYPVVQYDDNDYYLTHNIYDEYSKAGWVFADYRNKLDGTDKNIILYAHNRLNGSMFGTLKKVKEKNWYKNKDNLIIKFFIGSQEYNYQIFSIYETEPEGFYINTEFQNNDYNEFLKTIKERSIIELPSRLNENSKILTLSTCTSGDDKRLVVHTYLKN
ncbi:MAG: class B sortase [Bacilli bacterium]|nr:class B sortase [Bacilli bacterium]